MQRLLSEKNSPKSAIFLQLCDILKCATSQMHRKLKKTQYGTKNLSKGAKSSVRVFADIQNFALRARHSHGSSINKISARDKLSDVRVQHLLVID